MASSSIYVCRERTPPARQNATICKAYNHNAKIALTAISNTPTSPEIVLHAAALMNGVIVGLTTMTVEALVGFCGWPSVYSETGTIVVRDIILEVVDAVVMGPEVGVVVEEILIVVVNTAVEVEVAV